MNINTISLNLPLALTSNKNKAKISKIFILFSLISILFLGIFYVFQINIETTEKYLLASSEKELLTLIQKKESLNVLASDSGSLNSIISLIENSERGFIKADNAYHLKIVDSNIVSI